MIKKDVKIIMRAIALCYKPYLKPEEAFIYCDLERTQFAKRCEEIGVSKNEAGYSSKEDLDLICTRENNKLQLNLNKTLLKKKHFR